MVCTKSEPHCLALAPAFFAFRAPERSRDASNSGSKKGIGPSAPCVSTLTTGGGSGRSRAAFHSASCSADKHGDRVDMPLSARKTSSRLSKLSVGSYSGRFLRGRRGFLPASAVKDAASDAAGSPIAYPADLRPARSTSSRDRAGTGRHTGAPVVSRLWLAGLW